jgi:hypothetical protein
MAYRKGQLGVEDNKALFSSFGDSIESYLLKCKLVLTTGASKDIFYKHSL